MVSPVSNQARRILIVDHSDDSREVLRTVFENRGHDIYEADQSAAGLELAQRHHPDLIVIDIESLPGADCDAYDAQTRSGHTRLVVLGEAQRRASSLRTGEYVPKPYHYAPLIRKIEELLAGP